MIDSMLNDSMLSIIKTTREDTMEPEAIMNAVAETPERHAFYDRIGRKNLSALWLSLAELVTPEPRSPCQPASWRFADIRAAMIEAGDLITAKEAERRVLVLENPGLRGKIG